MTTSIKMGPPPASLRIDFEAERWLENWVRVFNAEGKILADLVVFPDVSHTDLTDVAMVAGMSAPALHVSQSGWDDSQNRLQSLEAASTSTDNNLAALQARVDSLETRMTTAENAINSLKTRMTTAETTLDNHQTTLDDHQTTLDDHETRLTAGGL